jgi:hypothetical protein
MIYGKRLSAVASEALRIEKRKGFAPRALREAIRRVRFSTG